MKALWPRLLAGLLAGFVTGLAVGFVNEALGVPFWFSLLSAFVLGFAVSAGLTRVK